MNVKTVLPNQVEYVSQVHCCGVYYATRKNDGRKTIVFCTATEVFYLEHQTWSNFSSLLANYNVEKVPVGTKVELTW